MDLSLLEQLIAIPSPSGFTHRAVDFLERQLLEWGFAPFRTPKGALLCPLSEQASRVVFAAHIDTLGAVVSSICPDGTLRFSPVGGPNLSSWEGEYVQIHTLDDQVWEGTILLDNPSVHANREVGTKKREPSHLHIRLDADVNDPDDVAELGIRVGDWISVEPRYRALPNGYIKSKFLDNKAGCFLLLELARRVAEEKSYLPISLFFSVYEEVGHGGASGFPQSTEELIVVDMGVVGRNVAGDEKKCSICAKDSSGPYDYHLRKRLIELAEKRSIPYEISVYPFYGSDGSAALRAGWDVAVALIGPGVAASHGAERTHVAGLEATLDLLWAYGETLR